ncbi:MAG: NifB/NifX family molybdenum-iron cluster-binding protein [Deltaproteobacteria bacterium]|nr:NifB/NifX family molybdenum-iron cluster-binding protein [Deltaproteobacteria bacterium]MBW1846978.1 NifB/NifX family molybdenum-iron cluster-binding protein [Deltaproteobacteria bacterium]MBW1983859.1 NifB/NifX family molybdenum-iron cluster-binding protein [Deltaproteobacteria bacterium]MBW2179775.1 NifB/NifX family molybdenum-iron cluster-binding protein [Deltaproteobacteria bacterium]
MKIAFPAQENNGLDSTVYNHFGSGKIFVIVETDDGTVETVFNQNLDHQHGQCQPMVALGGNHVDAVAVGGIGGGALRKLNAEGKKVFRAVEGSVKENLELIQSNKLPEITLDQTCAGHSDIGGCAH